MKAGEVQSSLLKPSVAHLAPIDPGLPILAFLAVSGHGSSSRSAVEKQLAALYPDHGKIGTALEKLAAERNITLSAAGRCRITDQGRSAAEAQLGKLLGRSWAEVRTRSLAGAVLGIDPRTAKARAYLSRKDNIECAALARLYNLPRLGAMPSRAELRSALLRALLITRLPECEPALMETPMQKTSRDAIGRAVMLGAAGLKRGTARDAETILLRRALSLNPQGKDDVTEALIRAGLSKNAAQLLTQPEVNGKASSDDLASFAITVRDLAKTLQTAPFTGRVAIAQVYDAAVGRGLDFGSLDAFKERVAAAGRAGLLDLERYDIAGPMDAVLRDRSRTAFGRDERHFIVNEWI